MTRTLVLIAAASFVLAVGCLSGAAALGWHGVSHHNWGPWGHGHGWNIHVRDHDGDDVTVDDHGAMANGAQTTREIAWNGGDRLDLDIGANVIFNQAPGPAKLVISGPSGAVQDVELSGSHLQFAHDTDDDGPLQVTLTAPNVHSFAINGSGDLAINNYDQDELERRRQRQRQRHRQGQGARAEAGHLRQRRRRRRKPRLRQRRRGHFRLRQGLDRPGERSGPAHLRRRRDRPHEPPVQGEQRRLRLRPHRRRRRRGADAAGLTRAAGASRAAHSALVAAQAELRSMSGERRRKLLQLVSFDAQAWAMAVILSGCIPSVILSEFDSWSACATTHVQ